MLQDVNLFAQIMFVRNIKTSLAVNMVKPRYFNRFIAIIKLFTTLFQQLPCPWIWTLFGISTWTWLRNKDCRISSRAWQYSEIFNGISFVKQMFKIKFHQLRGSVEGSLKCVFLTLYFENDLRRPLKLGSNQIKASRREQLLTFVGPSPD